MSIQWYPGHMAKAKRQIKENIKQIDVVIEIVDARIPEASRNPMVDEMTNSKPRLMLLNKADLADANTTKQWVQFYEAKGFAALPIDAQKGKGINEIPAKVREQAQHLLDKFARQGINPRAIRALILGIPNVGKSTVINRLANKKATKIGDKPGVTKAQQWIKVGKDFDLLDTPGILWPKFDDEKTGFRLALTGAIKEEIFDFEETTLFLLTFLTNNYPEALKQRYNLSELPENTLSLFDKIGEKRGCLMAGGAVNYEKAAEIIFRDFRQGKFGRITLEHPQEQ
ncbi:ribosome biogenesis GTPase YlqF [Salisediminibacterium halotolerans]|uniref:Ribosome biogenesis GTPase A n=1 Tax=Salisediminibacterium halotolerans TaxID=517425 RepID=A0A1H9Q181_9BACI|nr:MULTISPECIES: ribosome biogenesis GTPase YlqF [Salisediminibacterium]RLJ74241.1 Ras superfamily GTP-binding protein YlqF [Actinophytocola xinjiangensis]RPE87667.1 Ras superfamily GTP-binding protein YlqF [Salisediminibacterium halotolerans]TWG35078.1 Ras superfamily GTP-binding protein YlqF [Salisediminibacterium halotolerans]SER54211.1 ribosome biogenesis GTPase A [Salisediminibacterium haloalkalitolerans]GEL06874.1 ribosome biogenesis GTPase A [Salisediminibacterium halotolerans]